MNRLSDLKEGEKARVVTLENNGDIKRRLQDIGLIPGTVVTCVQKSPCGDPVAYLIKGALIAIRCEDSDKITVEGCLG